MSRTVRRKEYEKRFSRPGSKIAGYYTVEDVTWLEYDKPGSPYRHYSKIISYRSPTDRERGKAYWKLHADNHPNAWGPGKEFRKSRMKQNRSINKSEIQKWIKNSEHAVLWEVNPRDNKWDWD